jgi:hypothetical protein
VFPARYELNFYIVFRKRLVSKRLKQTGFEPREIGTSLDMRIIFLLLMPVFYESRKWTSAHRVHGSYLVSCWPDMIIITRN